MHGDRGRAKLWGSGETPEADGVLYLKHYFYTSVIVFNIITKLIMLPFSVVKRAFKEHTPTCQN